ncbi:hypothetical protein HYH03_015742 [Edaphochlamys debaryana]|uniref:Guanylate cyclase domain-containing protein n=1 Tax=Edaphochlamys debaryana TaxID=47281 RepID=A0A835XKM3_9CHLO|nr:hypothetical protein HYH03_015742 [Edaphochlamys debaryana]|eukprot:KAG2485581.1 hypothetical protein HYH03_015742 [Edaphochlamys debaryana]
MRSSLFLLGLLTQWSVSRGLDTAGVNLVAEDFCVATTLGDGCTFSRGGNSSASLWGAVVALTRDCGLDPTPSGNHSSFDSVGLLWLVGVQSVFHQFLVRHNAETGLTNWYKNRTVGEYISNWVEVWPTPEDPGPNDWWMLGSEVFGEDLDHGAFLDLTRLLTADPGFALSDIPVQFRAAGSSAYAGQYTAMPLWLTTYNLLYRRDIFEQYNLSVPATWDDALDIADKYGRGVLGPGQPDLGFCFESNPACGSAQAIVIYILASMVQLKGASDGAWFDPRASHNSSSMSGRQGVAGTPGSAVVMDRNTGRMGPCTREACPSAKEEPDPRKGGSRLVNQVVPIDGAAFAINRHAPAHRQAAAYSMLSVFTGAKEHLRVALLPYTEVTPIRYSELDPRSWQDAGYNPRDVRDFLADFTFSFKSENVYYELRIPGTFQIYTLVQYLLYRYNANNYTYEELMSWANEGTERIFASLGGRDRLRPLYQGSIGYKPPPPPAPSSGGSSSGTLLIAVLLPSLVSLVLLGGALWAYLRCARLRDERRARLRAAPGAGPGTTLLVTDIQDSTCLWESLPASVMDVALKTHHRVIRQLLIQHAGYESATEGDSFILAFAKPDRALAFALSAQDALLAAEWPGELLDSAHAPTLVVTHDTTACAAAQLSIAGPALLREVFGTAPAVDVALGSMSQLTMRMTSVEASGPAALDPGPRCGGECPMGHLRCIDLCEQPPVELWRAGAI